MQVYQQNNNSNSFLNLNEQAPVMVFADFNELNLTNLEAKKVPTDLWNPYVMRLMFNGKIPNAEEFWYKFSTMTPSLNKIHAVIGSRDLKKITGFEQPTFEQFKEAKPKCSKILLLI